MAEPIHDKIKRSIQAAEGLYHRLVLLVGETGSGKTGVLRDIAEEFGSSVVNVTSLRSFKGCAARQRRKPAALIARSMSGPGTTPRTMVPIAPNQITNWVPRPGLTTAVSAFGVCPNMT